MNRPHNTELKVDPHVAQWAVRTMSLVFSSYAVIVGLTILVGGRVRFTGLSYEVALATPGAPWSWGAFICAAGLASVIGSVLGYVRLAAAGMGAASLWSIFFAITFARAAFNHDEANTTAMWTYSIPLGVGCMVLAGVYYSMRPLRLSRRKASSRVAT